MKIGIPRALLYYYYFPLWKTLFEELGAQVVVSDISSREIIDEGVKEAVPEICVPIKIYIGHILNLLSKDVDYVFVPRFTSIRKGEFFCPKFMGLPDMIKHSLPQVEDKLIEPHINSVTDNIGTYDNFKFLEDLLDVSPQELKSALKKSEHIWEIFRGYSKQGYDILSAMEMPLVLKRSSLR
jgi:predicted nucleotide-binding protein (sugar kinase/HSP70/actin superfamily)